MKTLDKLLTKIANLLYKLHFKRWKWKYKKKSRIFEYANQSFGFILNSKFLIKNTATYSF